MDNEILQAVLEYLANEAELPNQITAGSLLQKQGVSAELIGSEEIHRYLSGAAVRSMELLFLSRYENGADALGKVAAIFNAAAGAYAVESVLVHERVLRLEPKSVTFVMSNGAVTTYAMTLVIEYYSQPATN